MTLLEKIQHIKEVWKAVLPNISLPTNIWLARWCLHDTEVIEAAIAQSAYKFSRETNVTADRVHRYTSKTMLNMAEQSISKPGVYAK
jgi:hypothetical protein